MATFHFAGSFQFSVQEILRGVKSLQANSGKVSAIMESGQHRVAPTALAAHPARITCLTRPEIAPSARLVVQCWGKCVFTVACGWPEPKPGDMDTRIDAAIATWIGGFMSLADGKRAAARPPGREARAWPPGRGRRASAASLTWVNGRAQDASRAAESRMGARSDILSQLSRPVAGLSTV